VTGAKTFSLRELASGTGTRTLWSWIAALLLAAVLLYFSLRGVAWGRVWQTIATADWRFLALGAALTVTSFAWRALRWRILLNATAHLSFPAVFWANMAGYLGNCLLPARAGEFIRSYLISRRSALSKTYVLTTALGERLMDVIALVLASSIVLLGMEHKPAWMADLCRTMAFVSGVGAVAVIVAPHAGGLVDRILHLLPLPLKLRGFLLKLASQVLDGLRAFHDWGRLGGFVLLTCIIWFSDGLGMIFGLRTVGVSISFPIALLLLTALGLGSALPSTPGYVGIFQFVAVTVLSPFGIAKDRALAFILLYQAMGYVVTLALGFPGLYRSQTAERPT
jgi:uncharacterized membrane protein YbhN (UPF0104 family)